MTKSCCSAPSRHAQSDAYLHAAQSVSVASEDTRRELRQGFIALKGGFFDMGARKSTYPADFDAPRRRVKLSPFEVSPTACTNAEFGNFVAETGYRTVAEIEGWSYVFHILLDDADKWPQSPALVPWWRRVDGAYWAAPEGPGSDTKGRSDHPVIHVSRYEALAYCIWVGLQLPTEAQWEFAARGGLSRAKFPWGNEKFPNGAFAMNTWQGAFPNENSGDDGFVGTAPVTAFAANGYGLFNSCGNFWEWVHDRFEARTPKGPFPLRDPKGPDHG